MSTTLAQTGGGGTDRAFRLESAFTPAGDQPTAIAGISAGLLAGERDQVLLGVTGSGKTFTMARVIADLRRPALVLAPNKTLAAQLYGEMKSFFPDNAVEYFVSYYDYYQPEAYVPRLKSASLRSYWISTSRRRMSWRRICCPFSNIRSIP